MAEEVFVTLIKNFDEQSTDEAKFAYKVDKLECDIQAKIYDEQKYLKLENANDKVKKDPFIKKISEKGVKEAYKYFIYMGNKHISISDSYTPTMDMGIYIRLYSDRYNCIIQ